MRRLYTSEPYRMPTESGLEDGGALMYGVGIDSSQLRGFLLELLDRRIPSENELKEVRSLVLRRVRGGGRTSLFAPAYFWNAANFFRPIVSHKNNHCILVLTFLFYPPEQK